MPRPSLRPVAADLFGQLPGRDEDEPARPLRARGRNVEDESEAEGQRFTGTRRSDEQDVTFTQFYAITGVAVTQTFVVVIYRYRQHSLRLLLSDDIVVKVMTNFMRRWQCATLTVRRNFFNLFANDVVT